MTIQKARTKVILWAYFYTRRVTNGEYRHTVTIPIDDGLISHFLWCSLAQAYAAVGDVRSASEIYDWAIEAYQAAIHTKVRNTLLWRYEYSTPADIFRWGIFDIIRCKQSLSDSVLWAAVGLAYQLKGESLNAVEAFKNALRLQPCNEWLRNVVDNLPVKSFDTREGISQVSFEFEDTYEAVFIETKQTAEVVLGKLRGRNDGSIEIR